MKDHTEKLSKEVEFIDLKVVDISGRIRHILLPGNRLNDELFEEGIGFDASNYGYATVEDSDMIAVPDEETAFIDPFYESKTLSFFCNVYTTSDGNLYGQYPRNVLINTLKELKSVGAKGALLAPELEFHIFDAASYSVGVNKVSYEIEAKEGYWNSEELSKNMIVEKKTGYHRSPPADYFAGFRNEAVKHLIELGIPVKYHHHEVSSAQHEIELYFQDALKTADSIIIIKYLLHNLAYKYGIRITFMPKPLYGEAGNGMHIHQFLYDEHKNLFSGDSYSGLGEMALSYVAGILQHSLRGSLLAFTNPTTNSYRRLVPGFEAPICAAFARGNRSAAIRIPGYVKKAEKVRVEFRTIDASCNPYYGISAMLLAGIDGIKRKLDPRKLNFGPLESNIYEMTGQQRDQIQFFPTDLSTVLNGLKDDKDYLSSAFDDKLIENWFNKKGEEANYIMNIPSPAEYQLYFDL
ncbi:MAG: type I glutamate--ammonia ligase [Kosmotogaceae bacterium]